MGTKLYVGNLNYNTGEQALRELFSANGRDVISVAVIMDRETGRSRGFAFVEMATPEGAAEALRELDGKDLEGRQLRINEARERDSRGPSGPPRGPRPGGGLGPPTGGGGGYDRPPDRGPPSGGGGGYDRPAGPPPDRARTFGPPAPPAGERKRPQSRKDKEGGPGGREDERGKRGGARRRTGDDGD